MSAAGIEKRGSAATVRACDLCRKRKRRCLWNSGVEGCTPCVNLKETCTTTHIRKQRAKPQRGNRIAEYETRIHKLESMLQERNAAQPQVEEQPLEPGDASVPATEWVANLRSNLSSIVRPNLDDFEALYADTILDEVGLPPNEAPSGVPTSFLPQETDDSVPDIAASLSLEEFEPSADFQEDAAFLQNIPLEAETVVDDDDDALIPPTLPETPVCDWYLPPPELGTALLSEFLVDFNTAYPLYRPHVIADHLRVCYAGESDGSAVSWTSAYIIFGLAHMLRGMSATATKHDNELAKYYLARTYTSLSSLLLAPPSLGLVQCLIGVALLIRTTPCGRNVPDGHFLSTSLRVAQSLAYHDEEDSTCDTTRDVQQERRVFWLAFINDTTTSMVSNSPTTHRREDIVAPKPEENPSDSLGAVVAAEGQWKVNIFSLRVNLALLQAEAIEQVLSVKARNTAPEDLDAATALVLARLRAFHDHEIFKISPAQLFQLLYRSDIAHTVTLEASYFATTFRLQAFLALDKNPRINPFALDGLRRLSTIAKQKSYPEARRLLSLLPIAPRGDSGLYWKEHQMFIAALVVVLAHHLNNPKQPKPTKDEIRVYNELIADLGVLDKKANDENTHIAQSRELCMSLIIRLETGLRIQWLQDRASSGEVTPSTLRV
ncbi:hypothetical protein CC86DRAFT_444586 [Ophiobolus disseminans]|uniref:Zn(2)-C6 fungal-type domain-containing protein n=1 Tax=Ophiobolus disseminans TaxID=1469910 RepID=A0A6A7A6S9_9PLEO|nr:hypothetical protein CC86DRAFT_444586 [Ophiobolus disseminans]